MVGLWGYETLNLLHLKDRLLGFEAILADCSEVHRIMKSYDKDWKCTWDFSAESEGVHMDV